MSAQTFTSQSQEDQALELCLRCDDAARELFADRTLELCAAITEKRLHGWADWFTKDDLETLIALYGRTESSVVKSEIESTMEFVFNYSHDEELIREAQGFLGKLETPIVGWSKRRILEKGEGEWR